MQIGKPATFEIHIRNAGETPASAVEVRDVVPKGTQFVSALPAATPGPQGDLRWDLGTMRPGEERVVKIDLLPVAEGELGSVASVHFSAAASVRTISTRPALKVEVQAPNKVLIGDQLLLKIRVSNPGTGPATGVVLSEQIPEGLRHEQGELLEYEVGLLKPGEMRDLELNLKATKPGVVNNVLVARGDGALRNEAAAAIEIVAPALQVSLDGPTRRYLDREATYTITVGNPGTAAAKDVSLVAYLPKGFKFVKADNYGEFDAAKNAVFWELEQLPPKQQGTVNIDVLPIEAGEHTLGVEGAAQLDLFTKEERKVLVEGVAAIQFQVVDVEDPIEVGRETMYEIRVTNQGSKTATNVQLLAILPPQLKPLDAEGPVRHLIDGNQVRFEPLSRLAPRADTTYRVKAQGVQKGDLRVRVQLLTNEMSTPVTKEESTRVYGDE